MMKKLILFIGIAAITSSCFKSEILDKEENEHFYFSDYYLNQFEDFDVEMVEKRLDPIYGATITQIIGYQGDVDIRVSPEFYNNLKQNWDHIIKFNDIDITDENQIITLFAGGFTGSTQSFNLEIELINQGNSMATETTIFEVVMLP